MTDPGPRPRPGGGVVLNGPGPHDWLDRYETVALVVLASLPLVLVCAWGLVRWRRRRGATAAEARRRSVAEVGVVCGTAPWLWLTLLPAGHGPDADGSVSLVPLRDLAGMPGYQVVGNLLVLAAVGAFVPLRWPDLASLPRVLLLAAGCSVAIELAQLVLALGRVTSVDDVLLNTVGAGLAALASRRWWSTSALPAGAGYDDHAAVSRAARGSSAATSSSSSAADRAS